MITRPPMQGEWHWKAQGVGTYGGTNHVQLSDPETPKKASTLRMAGERFREATKWALKIVLASWFGAVPEIESKQTNDNVRHCFEGLKD